MSRTPTIPIGSLLVARWIVGAPLGAGENGEVYEGEEAQGGRLSAIKVLDASFRSNAAAWSTFQNEVRTVSALPSEGIARVYDAGVDGKLGRPFVAGERVMFPSLARYVAERGPLQPQAVKQALITLARALDQMHGAGVVHGAIKPQNVFISFDNPSWARLTDYGLARLKAAISEHFTPLGWAPLELNRGGAPDAASDRFALALVVFFALTGMPWLSALTAAGTARDGQWGTLSTPASVRAQELGGTLDPAFDHWFRAALASDPAARYASASEMAQALANIVDNLSPGAAEGAHGGPGVVSAVAQPLVFRRDLPQPTPTPAPTPSLSHTLPLAAVQPGVTPASAAPPHAAPASAPEAPTQPSAPSYDAQPAPAAPQKGLYGTLLIPQASPPQAAPLPPTPHVAPAPPAYAHPTGAPGEAAPAAALSFAPTQPVPAQPFPGAPGPGIDPYGATAVDQPALTAPPPYGAAPATAAAVAQPATPAAVAPPATPVAAAPPAGQAKPKSRAGLIALLAATGLLLVGGALGAVLFVRSTGDAKPEASPVEQPEANTSAASADLMRDEATPASEPTPLPSSSNVPPPPEGVLKSAAAPTTPEPSSDAATATETAQALASTKPPASAAPAATEKPEAGKALASADSTSAKSTDSAKTDSSKTASTSTKTDSAKADSSKTASASTKTDSSKTASASTKTDSSKTDSSKTDSSKTASASGKVDSSKTDAAKEAAAKASAKAKDAAKDAAKAAGTAVKKAKNCSVFLGCK